MGPLLGPEGRGEPAGSPLSWGVRNDPAVIEGTDNSRMSTVNPARVLVDRDSTRLNLAATGPALWLGALLLFAANLALKYPGTLNGDSVQQFSEAITGRFTDWHPPVMAWVWSHLAPERLGSRSMLLLHLVPHWLGFALLADALRLRGRVGLAWLMLACGAFPVFFFYSGLITKDVGMGSGLLLAFALGFRARALGRRLAPGAAVVLVLALAYGTLVRTNAIFALGPLLLYFAGGRLRSAKPVAWAVASIALAVLALPVSSFVNHRLIGARDTQAIQSLMLFDLNGIAAQVGPEAVLPPELRMTRESVARCYTPYYWDTWARWGACSEVWSRLGPDDSLLRAGLKKQWLGAIAAHPAAYAEHRLKHFNSMLSWLVPSRHCRYAPGCGDRDPKTDALIPITPHEVQVDYLRRNLLVWPITWLVVSIGLLGASCRSTRDEGVLAVRALSLSSVMYLGALLFIGVATDVRYAYWSIMAGVVGLVIAIDAWQRGAMRSPRWLQGTLAALGLAFVLGYAARLADWSALLH